MATAKREKGVILNSRGTYEVRLAGSYWGSRKSLKEANALSLATQESFVEATSMQAAARKRVEKKALAVKKTATVAPTKIPCPCEASVTHIQRLEEQPKKKSFWQFLKDMFK